MKIPPVPKTDQSFSAPATPSSSPPSRLSQVLQASLPRLVGFGLFTLFGLDVVQLALAYHYAPLDPQADAQLAMQLIERSGVLLVAYVLVFLDLRGLPSRASRAAMKLLSWAALPAMVGFFALGVMSAFSGVRVYRSAVASLQQQYNQSQFALRQAETKLPTLSPSQAAAILAEVDPNQRQRLATYSPEKITEELRRQIPIRRKESETQLAQNLSRLRREQAIFSGKYLFGGIMVALILLLVFENTRPARLEKIFARGGSPNLKLEDQVVRGVGHAYQSMERVGDLLLPDLSGYRWYRTLRRKFRRDKK